MGQDLEQAPLFDLPLPAWTDKWKGMPGYEHRDLQPFRSLIVHFASAADVQSFAALIGQKLTSQTRSIWYPPAAIGHFADRQYVARAALNPIYPVYIISKGRWESRFTSKALEKIGVPYHIVIEPQEYTQYAAVIAPEKILTLPFSNLGQGSIPVRNWVWEHSISIGAERHWILDDNIKGFYRFQDNLKCPVADGAIFRAAEEFTDRYENVPISGFNYFMFVTRKSGRIQPFTLNTRVYSCILIRNDLPQRWRGRYNEDTDLCIRVLKDGHCTLLFNAFLAGKSTTMTMKGGNTDELYKDDGRLKMAQSLQEQHPDIARIVEKWGRYQHHVDYRVFKRNRLKLKPGVEIPEENTYEMSLQILSESDAMEPDPEVSDVSSVSDGAAPTEVGAPLLEQEPEPESADPEPWDDAPDGLDYPDEPDPNEL